MKLLVFVALMLSLEVQSNKLEKINPMQFQCTLSLEVSCLEYNILPRSMSIRIRFTSNCLRLRDFIFELPFTFKDRLSMKQHPKIVELDIFRNKYTLSFKEMKEVDMHTILRKKIYTKVSLSPSSRPTSRNVSCEGFNRLFLEERRRGSFGVRKLNNLLYMENPIRCTTDSNLKKMFCRIK